MTISSLSPTRFHHNKSKLNSHFSDLVKELTSTEVTTVGNYDLLETIGKGSYGKVKLAKHKLTEQQVAIKIVDKSHAHTAAREIEMWRHLHHPNITQLLEILTTETKIYMVMEHVTGGELFECITTHGALDEPCGRHMFRKLLSAVDYIHKKKYVHRDLKLENILLDKNLDPKIIDFGFTRGIQSRRLLDTYCGSLAYVAPEVITGSQYSGQETDVWSLGVILYTMMCGYLPFDDEDENIMQRLIVNADYSFPEGLSKGCQDLISGILRRNPTDRFTVDEILKHPWIVGSDVSMDYEMVSSLPSHFDSNEHYQSNIAETIITKIPLQSDLLYQTSHSVTELRLCSLLTSLGMSTEMMKKSVKENLCDSLSALYYLLLKKNGSALNEEKEDLEIQKRRPASEDIGIFHHPRSLLRASGLLFKESKESEISCKSQISNGKRTNIQKLKTRTGFHEFKLPSPPFFKRFDLHFIRRHKPTYSNDNVPNKPLMTIASPISPNLLDKPNVQLVTPLKCSKTQPSTVTDSRDSLSREKAYYNNSRSLTVFSNDLPDHSDQRDQVITNFLQRSAAKPNFRAIQTTITEEDEDAEET